MSKLGRMTQKRNRYKPRRTMFGNMGAAFTLGAHLSGCTSTSPVDEVDSGPKELSSEQVDELGALAQTPDDLGIALQILEEGGMRINRVRGTSQGEVIAADWRQDPARIPTLAAEFNGKSICAVVATGSSATYLTS